MNKFRYFLTVISSLLWAGISLHAQNAPLTNTVFGTLDLTAFVVDGRPNLSLTLLRGVTYVFQISETSAPIHPFYIKTAFTNVGALDAYSEGVTGNGATSGNLIFSVPMDAPDVLYYHCGNHLPMGAVLNIITPASPPAVRIVLVSITDTGIMMQSIGASNWTAIPEFSSNLMLNAWATVPNYTNTFAGGTNTTTFDRLDPICGPNVFLRMRNQSQ